MEYRVLGAWKGQEVIRVKYLSSFELLSISNGQGNRDRFPTKSLVSALKDVYPFGGHFGTEEPLGRTILSS